MSRAARLRPEYWERCAVSAACFRAAYRRTFTRWVIAARGVPAIRAARGRLFTTSLLSHAAKYSHT